MFAEVVPIESTLQIKKIELTFALKKSIHRSFKVVYEDIQRQLAVFVMPFIGIKDT